MAFSRILVLSHKKKNWWLSHLKKNFGALSFKNLVALSSILVLSHRKILWLYHLKKNFGALLFKNLVAFSRILVLSNRFHYTPALILKQYQSTFFISKQLDNNPHFMDKSSNIRSKMQPRFLIITNLDSKLIQPKKLTRYQPECLAK